MVGEAGVAGVALMVSAGVAGATGRTESGGVVVVTGGPPGFPPALFAPRPVVSADVTMPGEPAPAGGPCMPGRPWVVVARGAVCALSRLKWALALSLMAAVSRTALPLRLESRAALSARTSIDRYAEVSLRAEAAGRVFRVVT